MLLTPMATHLYIIIAARSKHLKVVDYLVRDMKCDLWSKNNCQNPPMHCVCEEGRLFGSA